MVDHHTLSAQNEAHDPPNILTTKDKTTKLKTTRQIADVDDDAANKAQRYRYINDHTQESIRTFVVPPAL